MSSEETSVCEDFQNNLDAMLGVWVEPEPETTELDLQEEDSRPERQEGPHGWD